MATRSPSPAGSITLTADQLAGLTLHAGAESDGPYNLTMTATDTETDTTRPRAQTIERSRSTSRPTPRTLSVTSQTLSVDEGGAVALNITAIGGGGRPGRQPTITIDGLGDATLTNTHGDTLTVTGGSITLTARSARRPDPACRRRERRPLQR